MVNLIVQISRYLIVILMALYTIECFTVFRRKRDEESRQYLFLRQNMLMFFIHFIAYTVIFLEIGEFQVLLLYAAEVVYLALTLVLFRNLYPRASRLLINNMCMLLTIGFIMLARLSYDQCVRQFGIAVIATAIALLIPVIIRKLRFITRIYWAYTLLGLGLLALVAIAARAVNGAKISFTVAGITLQPSEFVKIIFVFAIAGLLTNAKDFRRIALATVLAAVHVLILVVSTDLGSALIFFITYLVMLFIATKNPFYTLVGILAGSAGAVGSYFLFSHIRVRVRAWLDPFADYQVTGYQVAQGLFSVAAGGWIGTGLFQGTPDMIPYVEEDMMFAAIAEELGGIFGICLILVCMSCFIMIVNIGMQLSNRYYRLVAVGLGTTYAVQVFLTIGGSTKLIPLTGVTLPLVSYGGSSLLSTLIMFAIVQGLYMLRSDEALKKEEQDRQQWEQEQQNGYDPNAYRQNGYDPNGYDPNAYAPNGYPPNGYPPNDGQGYNGPYYENYDAYDNEYYERSDDSFDDDGER